MTKNESLLVGILADAENALSQYCAPESLIRRKIKEILNSFGVFEW